MSEETIYLTKARDIPSPRHSFQQLISDLELLPGDVSSQDVYGDFTASPENSLLRRFEQTVSTLLNQEDAIFMISGVMAQEIALSIHSQAKSPVFLCHYTSHLLIHEQNGYQELLHLTPIIIPPLKDSLVQYPLTADQVIQAAQGETPPSVIVVECPHRELGGKITPWEDLLRISEFCRSHGISLHMDGARLWEATVAYQKSLAEICSLFDSVYVSFYKGLGGMTGAMLLGKASFIAQSRVWLRRFGGNIFTALPYAVSGWAGLIRNVGTFPERAERMRAVARLLTALFQKDGRERQIIRFDPEVPEVSLVHVYLRGPSAEALLQIKDRVVRETSIACFTALKPSPPSVASVGEFYFEFNVVSLSSPPFLP
jgi:threonine aldolase